ncbi:MAG: hypothetical protein E7773_11140 [Sphingomonas sp.]|uniref:hypothetical protein n=1 Tax=Sphingomonas sp. TaxID=28214 RepID=UPI001219149D|nr:hypothetical protein [Sphingomonas sp.]THD35015.1 MAG: hypothetical protein E7773_11140 [Sphingomonas sp.]
MKITVDEAAPGSGKTHNALSNMISFPARYLFVTERKESIHSITRQCRELGVQRHRHVRVWPVDADNLPTSRNSVREEVEALPNHFRDEPHVIAIITHAALLMSDLSDFTGWHVIIDEVPNVLSIQEVQTLKDTAFFADHYTLEKLDGYDGWSVVGLTARGRALTSRHLYQDDSHRHLRSFHSRVLDSADHDHRRVVCNLTDWGQMGQAVETTAGKLAPVWIWGSLFTLSALAAFETVTILANRFRESLSYKLLVASAGDLDIRWTLRASSRPIAWQRRSVRVVYFSERRASRYHLLSETGREHLTRIDAYLAAQMGTASIWSTNGAFAGSFTSLPSANRQPPKQAGSNEFVACNEAAIIYSAKASPNVRGLLATHGVSEADWIATNENEIVLQFLTRTSLRNPASAEPVTLYVYDRAQADYVAERIGALPHADLSVEHVDLGVETAQRPRGRKPRILSPDEIEAKAKARRDYMRDYQRAQRAAAKGGAA